MRQFFKLLRPVYVVWMIVSMAFSGQATLDGSITYISRDNAYIDLGKKSGVAIGDTVMVYNDGQRVGTAIVAQTSGSSSSVKALEPTDMNWSIGNKIGVLIQQHEPPPTRSSLEPLDSVNTAEPAQVFLDSSAYAPRSRSNMSLGKDRFAPSFTGYLSTRISDRGGDTSGVRETHGSMYGQFKVMDLGIKHLDASVYLRGNQSIQDSSSQFDVYSVMFSYDNPESKLSYLMGRMYHPQFSMLGTLDGVGITWRSDRRILAMTAGLMPVLSHTSELSKRQKLGLMDNERFGWGNLQLGVVSELEDNSFSRNFIVLGASAKVMRRVRLKSYGEFDLDLWNQSQQQDLLSLSRFRSSLNWRPWRSLIANLRYSYRENIIDLLDTAETEYDKAARHTFNANLNYMLNSGLTFSGQASFRGDGDGRQIQIYGLTMNHRKFTSQSLALHAGGMAMLSYLSEGGRVYASLSKDVLPWLDVDLYDEIFMYRILGESSFRTRHLPEISFSAKVPGLQRLRLRTRLEQESGEVLYRMTLSASKQF